VRAASAGETLPVPIRFVYREANFTEQGRAAAVLLLEYLRLKRVASVTLTGHADERGSYDLNMELSAERLKRVERFLREGGYTGELTLMPKGKTEPFAGVDRTRFAQSDLYELDRRVELKVYH
jgi:outer membrane protein OmpA-like peptidoglycan-associated protein